MDGTSYSLPFLQSFWKHWMDRIYAEREVTADPQKANSPLNRKELRASTHQLTLQQGQVSLQCLVGPCSALMVGFWLTFLASSFCFLSWCLLGVFVSGGTLRLAGVLFRYWRGEGQKGEWWGGKGRGGHRGEGWGAE